MLDFDCDAIYSGAALGSRCTLGRPAGPPFSDRGAGSVLAHRLLLGGSAAAVVRPAGPRRRAAPALHPAGCRSRLSLRIYLVLRQLLLDLPDNEPVRRSGQAYLRRHSYSLLSLSRPLSRPVRRSRRSLPPSPARPQLSAFAPPHRLGRGRTRPCPHPRPAL